MLRLRLAFLLLTAILLATPFPNHCPRAPLSAQINTIDFWKLR